MTTVGSAPPVTATGPCGWTPIYQCDTAALDELDADVADDLAAYAAELLWRRTGRMFGQCAVTVRPCSDDCRAGGSSVGPVRIDGQWTNAGCGCVGSCGCGSAPAQVTLPGPVAALVDVTVDGVSVPLDQFRIDNWTTVVWHDGTWPACQHLAGPADTGWTITYMYGRPLPVGGQIALGRLTAELAKACTGGPCQLPATATSIQRQGVNVQLPSLAELVDAGSLGMFDVDQWVASVQPGVATSYSPIRTPDLPELRVQTWP